MILRFEILRSAQNDKTISIISNWKRYNPKRRPASEIEMTGEREIRQIILRIVEKIVKEYQPRKIILFGSYAWQSSA
jgi:hypothetical protein